jgi:HEAT repeat protein
MRLTRPTQAQACTAIGILAFAAFVVLRWGAPPAPAIARPVAELAEQLREPFLERRREAAEALALRASEAGPARSQLLVALADPDLLIRSHAAMALGKIKPPVVGLLIEALNHPNAGARHGAAVALGLIGAPAAPAVPRLVEMLRAPEVAVQHGTKVALERIGPPAVPALLGELLEGPPAARATAAEVLGVIGGESATAMVGPLGVALNDPDEEVRQSAAGALANLGPAAAPILAKALAGPQIDRRRLAARSLAALGPAATSVASDLITALTDRDPFVRSAAADALGQIGHAARAAVPALLAMQNDDATPVRTAATRALVRIIEDAPTAKLGRNGGSRVPQTHLNP